MRVKIAFFFSILFTVVLIAPTVINLVDDAQEVSILLDLNEEEENKEGKESKIDAELKLFASSQNSYFSLYGIQENKNIRFKSKYFFTEYSKIDTPPPKLILIS